MEARLGSSRALDKLQLPPVVQVQLEAWIAVAIPSMAAITSLNLLDATNSSIAVTIPHLLRSICDEVLQDESSNTYSMYHVVKIHHFKEKTLVGK